jgi:hypothetical protein
VGGVSVGGGGGSGAALNFFIDGGGPITGGPVVIGAGGIGGLGLVGSPGAPTSVTINAIVYTAAPGNGGGLAFSAAGTATAQGGNTQAGSSAVDVVSGESGLPGIGVAGSSLVAIGGNGAGGEFGIGGSGSTGDGNGSAGSGFGSGGGGSVSSTVDQSGGDGTAGVVIIDEFA